MVCFSNALNYSPDQTGAPKERNDAWTEDGARKTDEAVDIASTSGSKYNSLNSPQLLELCLKMLKKHSMLKQMDSVLYNAVRNFKLSNTSKFNNKNTVI